MTKEETMAAAVAIAAAAVAIGGAGLALTYRRCCKERRTKKKIKIKDEMDDGTAPESVLHRLAVGKEEEDRLNLLGEASTSSPSKTARATVSKPGKRSVEEIKARYGRATRQDVTDTAAIASEAANKLLERGEKLQRLDEKTADLQAGAEDFASLAEELAKRMEKKRLF